MTAADTAQLDLDQRPPSELFMNRELSWLAFNERVLDEAFNPRHPLLERLRFLAISGNNLDEFFMVRVAGVKAQVDEGVTEKSHDGRSPSEVLAEIDARVDHLLDRQAKCWVQLMPLLHDAGLTLVKPSQLSRDDIEFLRSMFMREIFPLLTPIAIDPAHPFPFIPNKGVCVVMELFNEAREQPMDALVPLPASLARFLRLPDVDGEIRFVLVDEVIVRFHDILFPGMALKASGGFRVLRDSDLEIDEEAEDLVRTFEDALKRRRRGSVIRLSVTKDLPKRLVEELAGHFTVRDVDIHRFDRPLGLAQTSKLIVNDRADLLFPPYTARFPERIRDFGGDHFAAIRQKDIVVHHPYESFDVVVQFLRQAARDPQVVAIKQTLYRTSSDSPIIGALVEAAEAGKQVTAMVEIKARFDEEANLRWAMELERAGAHVIFGFIELKTHAKSQSWCGRKPTACGPMCILAQATIIRSRPASIRTCPSSRWTRCWPKTPRACSTS